jgi:hypothetical protein
VKGTAYFPLEKRTKNVPESKPTLSSVPLRLLEETGDLLTMVPCDLRITDDQFE